MKILSRCLSRFPLRKTLASVTLMHIERRILIIGLDHKLLEKQKYITYFYSFTGWGVGKLCDHSAW